MNNNANNSQNYYIAKNLKAFRNFNNLSLEQLSGLANISKSTLQR